MSNSSVPATPRTPRRSSRISSSVSLPPFSVLRTMDFTDTNNNPQVNWSDRSHATDATQGTANGVAWEYVIDLANATNKDIWINIPEGATDDYVKQLATLLKNNLNPGLHVYVEYSNELWNGSFSQFNANLTAAQAEASTLGSVSSVYDLAWRRIGQRIEQIRGRLCLRLGERRHRQPNPTSPGRPGRRRLHRPDGAAIHPEQLRLAR